MDQTHVNACFAAGYDTAREKFRETAKELGARVDVCVNANAEGPGGERLTTDVARFGGSRPRRVMFITSATHGAEGLCGSGAQVALMRAGLLDALPSGLAVVLVHAINPYGFAHLSRTTEENVDINRNFIDFSRPLPENTAYDEVHAFMLPGDWDGEGRWAAEQAMARYIAEKGVWAFQCAVSGGQYSYPDGLFYGGTEPSWSNHCLKELIGQYAGSASHVALIDFHTGLGPYGYGELIATGSAEEKARARRWYGEQVTDPDTGSSTSAPIKGTLSEAFGDVVPNALLASIAIEYGTVPVPDALAALRADNWLRWHGERDSGLGRTIKQRMRDVFYCDFDDWRSMVVTRALEIARKGVSGLEAES